MDIGRKDLIKESASGASGYRQHPKAKINHIDLSAATQVPAPPNGSRKRQLTGGRHSESFGSSHIAIVLGKTQ